MNETFVGERWRKRILPILEAACVPSRHPVTVFLGGQPGAGKTRIQRTIVSLYGDEAVLPIIGDDFRQYHPDYHRLVTQDPLSMPDETASAAGQWTGMAVDYAVGRSVSCIIEGTWRNTSTVLDEATRAK